MQVVVHSMMAQSANRQLRIGSKNQEKSTERLSSGYRINKAGDDAASLTISEKMRWQIKGLERASKNSRDGISYFQVADGAMSEMHDMVGRMKELCIQAANDTNTKMDREAIQKEINQICDDIKRITDDTNFNTKKVFDKERRKITISGGATSPAGTILSSSIEVMNGNNYGLAEVIGVDHLSQNDCLNLEMDYSGSGWHSTGKAGYNYGRSFKTEAEINAILAGIDTRLSLDYSTLKITTNANPGFGSWNGDNFTYDDGSANVVKLSFSNGNLNSYGSYIQEYTVDANGMRNYFGQKSIEPYADREGAAAVLGNQYGSAWIDFSGAGIDYQISDLYDEGFNSTCATCSRYYNIKFKDGGTTTNSDGVKYTYSGSYRSPRLEIDISDCTNGSDIVQHIVSAVNSCNSFNNHYTQYAYNDSETAKIHIFDNRTYMSDGGRSTFEPTYRSEGGMMILHGEKTVTNSVGDVTRYSDADFWIQTGAESGQGIKFGYTWLNCPVLGIDGLSVLEEEDAQEK